ncbi:MAG: MFS transporter, partial [Actinomycetota bacterium]
VLARKRDREKRVDYPFGRRQTADGQPDETDEESQARRAELLGVWGQAGIDYETDAETGALTQVIRGSGVTAAKFRVLATRAGNMIEDMGRPFAKKDFRSLMLVQYLSMAGDGVVAGTILATVLNPQNAKTGKDVLALVFLIYLPFALIAPFVGVLADRFDRRKLLVFANNARAVLMVLGALMLLLGLDAVALLSALALLVLGGFRLTLLVKGAGLPDTVGGHDLLLANSLSQAGGTIFQAGGAVVATVLGLIIGNSGVIAILAVVLYLAAARIARGISKLASDGSPGKLGEAFAGVLHQVVEGVREIKLRPGAAVGILSFWFTRTLVFGFIALSISFEGFEAITGQGTGAGASKTELAISLLFAGLGAGIGLFGAQVLKDKVSPARVITTFMLLAGATTALSPITGRYFATFFAGLGFFLVKVAADTIVQQSMPDDFRGRAYAIFDITYAFSYAI